MNGLLFRMLYFAEILLMLLLFPLSIRSMSLKSDEKYTVDYSYGINLLRIAQQPNFSSLSLSELDRMMSQDLDRHGAVPDPKEMVIKFSNNISTFHMQLPSPSTLESCKNAKLLVVVYDRPEAFDVRNAIRQSWAENLPDGAVVRFMLGMRGEKEIDEKMLKELQIHDDLILSTLDDSYRTLYLKVAASYHWHQSFCPVANYFLKTDDDMTVVLDRLLHWIDKRFEPVRQNNSAVEFGWPLRKRGVNRDPGNKLCTSREEYPEDVYPDFLAGGAYLLSNEAVKRIIETTYKVHSLTIEDTLYTGIIAKEANILVEDASDIIAVWGQDKTSKCVDDVPLLTIMTTMSNDLTSPEKHKQYFDELKTGIMGQNGSRKKRNKVHISDDTWLEAIKFLTFAQWSQKIFVSGRITRIIERNILKLPKMVLERADMFYFDPSKMLKDENAYFKQKHTSTQWFKDRSVTFDGPVDVMIANVLVGGCRGREYILEITSDNKELAAFARVSGGKEGTHKYALNHNLTISTLILGEIPRSTIQNDLYESSPTYFNSVSAQHSWNNLAQFLELVYHPMSYIKKGQMFALNQKFIDSLKRNDDEKFIDSLKRNDDGVNNEPRYIRCESFLLEEWRQRIGDGTELADFSDSLKWLARNVRAETIQINDIDDTAVFPLLANFCFGASDAEQCALKNMEISVHRFRKAFLNILIEKFHAMSLIEGANPTINFFYFFDDELPEHLGPNLIEKEVDSEGAKSLFMISNGQNRMRISFCLYDELPVFMCKVSIYQA